MGGSIDGTLGSSAYGNLQGSCWRGWLYSDQWASRFLWRRLHLTTAHRVFFCIWGAHTAWLPSVSHWSSNMTRNSIVRSTVSGSVRSLIVPFLSTIRIVRNYNKQISMENKLDEEQNGTMSVSKPLKHHVLKTTFVWVQISRCQKLRWFESPACRRSNLAKVKHAACPKTSKPTTQRCRKKNMHTYNSYNRMWI